MYVIITLQICQMSTNEMDVDDDIEEEDKVDDKDGDNDEEEEDSSDEEAGDERAFLPGDEIPAGEELECDEGSYIVYHQASVGPPCLSFDIIPQAENTCYDNSFQIMGMIQ